MLWKYISDLSCEFVSDFFDKSLATWKQTITKKNHENIAVQKNVASEVSQLYNPVNYNPRYDEIIIVCEICISYRMVQSAIWDIFYELFLFSIYCTLHHAITNTYFTHKDV